MTTSEVKRDDDRERLRYVNVLDYLVVITKHRKFLIQFVVLSVFVALIVLYLFMSKWYKATAVIVAPKEKASLGILTSAIRSASPLRSLGLGAGASDDLLQYQTILKSRRCFEAVINRFDLLHVYHAANMIDASKELDANIEIGLGKEEVSLEMTVYDTDAQRAADMANFFTETLNKIYNELTVSEARGNREFLEQRYKQNLRDLKAAEDSLKIFQTKSGVYSIPDQMKAAIEAAAYVQSQIALREVQLGILEKTTTPNNSIREQTMMELTALRKQLAGFRDGEVGKAGSEFHVFPPFDKAPELGVQYFRLFREVELQGKILELILPLYEQAKIEEQRDTPSLLVLDSATPPEKASKPRRLLITGIVFLISLVVGTLLTFVVDALERARKGATESDKIKISQIRTGLNPRSWLR